VIPIKPPRGAFAFLSFYLYRPGSTHEVFQDCPLVKKLGFLLTRCKGEDRGKIAAEHDHQFRFIRNKLDAADHRAEFVGRQCPRFFVAKLVVESSDLLMIIQVSVESGPTCLKDFLISADVIKPPLHPLRIEEMSHSMPSTPAQRLRALDLLKARGMLRLRDFATEGIGPETLARLVREAAVTRAARGLYQLSDTHVEAAHALAEAAILVPKGVVCLTSALQYHELTLQMPSAVWMAIDRAAWRPKIDYPPIRFVRFTGWALTEGVERHRIENVDVPITDPARAIVDCFRYRTKVGLDVAMEGLREGLRRRRCTPDQLWQYARRARVWSVMRPYVEAMVSDVA
jgi:predicted transcriptional regulator of viral defense system